MLLSPRWPASLGLLAALTTPARDAHADAKACIESHEEGQIRQKEARLLEARDHFTACAAATCPDAISKECAELLRSVEASTPTVVFAVTDAAGSDVTSVTVTADGKALATKLDGRAVAVDPGERTFRFELPDGAVVEQRVLVREGEKNREVRARFEPAAATTDHEPARVTPQTVDARDVPLPALVFAGVGVVGLGVFGAFALDGRAKEAEMTDAGGCAPTCPEGDVSAMRSSYLVADVALGVGVASLGAAAFFWATARESPKQSGARAPRLSVFAHPKSTGAALHGRF